MTITFGHGSRHIAVPGLAAETVEEAIEVDIRQSAMLASTPGSFSIQTVEVEGRWVEYHTYVVDEARIHVGTYFVTG